MSNSNAKAQGQAWSRISVPVSGTASEGLALELAAQIAVAFQAQLNVLFTPPDPAELAPWLGEGFMGTVQMATMDSLKAAAEESELAARAQFTAIDCPGKTFTALTRGLPQQDAYDIVFRHCLDVAPTGDTLAFGTTTGSLFVSDDQGDSWQPLSNHLPPVYAVRFEQKS